MVGKEVVEQYNEIRRLREGAGEKRSLKPLGNIGRGPHPMWTYFILGPEGIKIGKSKSPKHRMKDLQMAHATELELIVAVPESQISEADAHARFQHLRLCGEWFRQGPDLLEFIETLKPKPATPHNPLIDKLHALRRAHGSKSAVGCHCSNIVDLLKLPKPPAALLKRQMDGLQRAWAQLN